MRTLYEAEQKRVDKLSRDEATREPGNEENSGWVTKQLKKALDPKDRDTVATQRMKRGPRPRDLRDSRRRADDRLG